MESIREIYKIGRGPSSSHTMGPNQAANNFRLQYSDAKKFRVTLYGSLAATGKGHLTDYAIQKGLGVTNTEIIWKPDIFLPQHPNGMFFQAYNEKGNLLGEWTCFSVGGGSVTDFSETNKIQPVYKLTTMTDILEWCQQTGKNIWELAAVCETEDIWDHLFNVWQIMKKSIHAGIEEEGTLPGELKLRRKAAAYYIRAQSQRDSLKRRSLLFAYALAVAEQNAAGEIVATAPTCGSCGVLPAVLLTIQKNNKFSDKKILRALATAGIIGNLVKYNASISGAEVGCQGEIGTACAMAAGAATQLFGGSPNQIEYAAEMGMEHHLGLTCDPVMGLVQIPCIERNAFAASRALDANSFAIISDGTHYVHFDKVVKTMKQTGDDLPHLYKETSEGGLAKHCDC
ncbi:MAG: L-serine ammonia-lyase [Fidelibacterota bacterium]